MQILEYAPLRYMMDSEVANMHQMDMPVLATSCL